ncbi:MAG TPA: hypothetical protein VKY15_01150, partial [Acidimicrobiales bacterium]|nr:hypothetical protein [Acidimicrobiales bacterium]
GGQDAWGELEALARGEVDRNAPLTLLDRVMASPRPGTGGDPRQPPPAAGGWTKGALLDSQGLNWELARQMGALPGADPNHTSEFFPWFVTEESGWGRSWGIELVTVEERRRREARYRAALADRLAPGSPIPHSRSPELVAPLVEALWGGTPVVLPLNLPNDGACPQLPPGAVVETMCSVDASGVRPREQALAPPALAEWLRRVISSQELTVQAATSADPRLLLQALACDPFTGRLDHRRLLGLRDQVMGAARPWLGG